MKTKIAMTLIGILAAAMPHAQTPPQAFSYQALVRDGAGAAVRNRSIDVRVRLHQDSATGTIAYAETFSPTTNAFGNINLAVGRGTVLSGTFSTLDWSRPMFIELGIDVAGGSNFTDLGTTQLLSVPFAMFSGRSATAGNSVTSEIRDADGNTRVSTERNVNENIIRFDLNGTEKMRLRGNALEFPNSGFSVYIGDSAGFATTSGGYNVFTGMGAGRVNVTGTYNVLSGYRSGYSMISGGSNVFLGAFSGYSATGGTDNTFIGYSAGSMSGNGTNNTAIGRGAGNSVSGNYNTFIGQSSGALNSSGSENTFIGSSSGSSTTSGINNVFVGTRAGIQNVTGSGNVYIGHSVGPIGDDNNKLYIDNNNTATPLIFGDFAANTVTINGVLTVYGFSNLSDRRLKENVAPLSNALASVGKLNGVSYDFKKDPEGIRPKGRQIGVIAQDVEKVYPELVTTTGEGYKAVDYPKLTAVLIEAVKELKRENTELRMNHATVIDRLERMEARLASRKAVGQGIARR